MENILLITLYFFALNYTVMFGAFYFKNDWALRFLFRYPLRDIIENSPSQDTLRWTSIGIMFHRMEASFGIALGVMTALMTYVNQGNLKALSMLSACVSIHAMVVCINHSLNYGDHAEFCRQKHIPETVRTTLGLMRYAAAFMALLYGALAVYGFKAA